MKHLRWAVVGLGIGQVHAATVASLEDASLVALCDQDSAVLERVAAQFPNAELYTDFDDLVENCEIDALVIATYDDSHAKLAAAALKRGIHVFVEKPLAATQEDLLEIAALLNSDPALRLSSNTLLRLSPRFAWLKSRIATGSLGRIYHAELSYLYGRLEKVADGWRGKSPAYSVTLGGTIHMIDLLLWLTGERPERCTAVSSSLGTMSSEIPKGNSKYPDDLRVALLEFPSGMTAQVGANFSCVLPHFHSVALFGSSGTFLHYPNHSSEDREGARIFSSRDPQVSSDVLDLPYPAVSKGALIPGFQGAIRGADLLVSEQEVVDATTVALAIDAAVANRDIVDIRYVNISERQAWAPGD